MNYVIYHDNCADGLSAASLHSILTSETFTYIPGVYGKSLQDYPDFTDANVLFIDFSFKEDDFKSLLAVAKDVQVIDHHISAHTYLSKIIEEENVFSNYIYDINECGTSLVWKVYGKTPESFAVKYVRDQDIYVWKHVQDSVPFCLYVETIPRTLTDFRDFWIEILRTSDHIRKPTQIIETGKLLLKLKQNYVDQICKFAKNTKYLDMPVIVCNCPNLFVNSVFDSVCTEEYPFLIGYTVNKEGINFSMRSLKGYNTLPITYSISKKGGGHTSASGAFLSFEDLETHPIKDIIFGA